MSTPARVAPDQDLREDQKSKLDGGWRVILYNDNVHKFEDVVLWIQKATGCSLDVAQHVTFTAHRVGRAVCFEGGKAECQRVAGSLRSHGLQVEVDDAV